mmetsp:Transcript_89359/g.237508  ORF Transcript_89359/g.237508 Transcript_89359/m.237508 type:complete len:223 (+) Transcript_89359:622-1290(+)
MPARAITSPTLRPDCWGITSSPNRFTSCISVSRTVTSNAPSCSRAERSSTSCAATSSRSVSMCSNGPLTEANTTTLTEACMSTCSRRRSKAKCRFPAADWCQRALSCSSVTANATERGRSPTSVMQSRGTDTPSSQASVTSSIMDSMGVTVTSATLPVMATEILAAGACLTLWTTVRFTLTLRVLLDDDLGSRRTRKSQSVGLRPGSPLQATAARSPKGTAK